jgi:transglutaminase-like putative cysteine protease
MNEQSPIGLRLATFFALATFAAANWVALVAQPPTGRAMLAALLAAAGAASLVAIAARVPTKWRAGLAAATTVTAIVVLAALALGLPARLLLPSGWGELGTDLGDGIGSLWRADYPYEGSDTWSRLALLLGLAPLLGLAAALSFWPREGERKWARRAGLLVLLVTYGVAVTVSPPSHPLLSGALLFVLVGAYLWSPSARRPALAAVALVAAAALAAIPVAARLDGSEPWLDYRNWEFGSGADTAVSFDWNHTYGPIDWPRDGRTLLEIHSPRPHYWATEVLDHFDGTAWVGSQTGPGIDLPLSANGFGAAPLDRHWIVRARFDVKGLSSSLLVGAGQVLDVSGIDGVRGSAEGVSAPSPLGDGDSYAIRAYDPQPTAARMRASEGPYPSQLSPYTSFDVPRLGQIPAPKNIQSPPAAVTLRSVIVPLRDGPRAAGSPAIAASAYAPVDRLAHRLADGKPTTYAVVQAMQRYLRSNYRYDESPPQAKLFPLSTFLFGNRRGYCQQFSGAMALMLRMVGIPTRVVGGFAPGEKTGDGFSISDFDAHSWVQVYFNGIGWVTFDPTPAAAPAIARSGSNAPIARGRRPFGRFRGGSRATKLPTTAAAPGRSGGSGGGYGWLAIGLVLATLIAASAILYRRRVARLRSLDPAVLAALQAAELEQAASGLGPRSRPGSTLRGLEASLRAARQPKAAAYAAQLRHCLYARDSGPLPDPGRRREARRALAKGLGARARLRSLFLMPPGGPAPPPAQRPG